MAKRTCAHCGAIIPWGTPQCPGCGAWTIWRRILASLGLLIGAGTVIAVLLSLARVYLLPPPPHLRINPAVERFLEHIAETPDLRPLIQGAGRCRDAPPSTLCVQMQPAFLDLPVEQRAAVRRTLADFWTNLASPSDDTPTVVLIAPGGQIVLSGGCDAQVRGTARPDSGYPENREAC